MSETEDMMVPKSKSIGEYLTLKKNQRFLIPSFQRAYSWNKDQCEKLLEDLFDYHENLDHNNQTYFFGNLITVEKDNDILIIDGQQRTTTFLLLLKALHFILNEYKINQNNLETVSIRKIDNWLEEILKILYKIDSDSIYNYETKDFTSTDKAKPILQEDSLILKSESMNELNFSLEDWYRILTNSRYSEVKPYLIPGKRKENKFTIFYKNLKYFYYTLKAKLDEGSKSTDDKISYLSSFIKTLLEDCKIIQIASRNIDQAVAVFNSLNATGLPLSDADVICSSAYSECKDKDTKMQFHCKWNKLTEDITTYLDQYFTVTTILQQFMYYQRFYKSALEGLTTDITTPGLRKYYTNDNKAIIENPLRFCENLLTVSNMWKYLITFPIIRLALKTNKNIHLFLSCIFYHLITQRLSDDKTSGKILDTNIDYDKYIKPIVELFLRLFALLELVDISYSSAEFKVFLFKIGTEVAKLQNDCNFENITLKFNENILKIITEYIGNIEGLKSELQDYRKDKLVMLNEYLFTKEHNIDFYFDEDQNRINIEHIMPQSGNNVPDYIANIFSNEDYLDYLDKLGNKILLERKINSDLSDDPFRTKKSSRIDTDVRGRKNAKQGYKDSKYAIARSLCDYQSDTWVDNDIDNATEKCVNRITHFIIDPLTDEQKVKLES